MDMTTSALGRAISICGSQSALARACGKKQAHVWWWLNRSKRVPAEHVIAVERATEGKITRSDLRPDIYPIELQVTSNEFFGLPVPNPTPPLGTRKPSEIEQAHPAP